ncbi:MAG: hypothetical protein LBF69_05355 [Prevotellaceae bacterium]|jgi:hypothetical protein|nr:hypothetical protein [Prevotellaceae bacterium]
MSNYCSSSGGNTGRPACDLSAIITVGIILTPKNAVIAAGTENLLDFFKSKFKEDVKANRWYPIVDKSWTVTNNSEEPVVGTLGSGYSEKLRDGNAIYKYDLAFGLCKSKTIGQFDGWRGGVFLVSNDGRIVGRRQEDGSLAAFLPTSLYTTANPLGDGQNISVISLTANFGNLKLFSEILEVSEKIEGFDVDELNGIIDVKLSVLGTASSSVDLLLKTKYDGINLFDVYSNKLDKAAAWKVVNKATGELATPTTVSARADTKAIRIALAAGTYVISLDSVSALEAAGLLGYESNEVTVVIA